MSSQENERYSTFGAVFPRVWRRFGDGGDGRARGVHGNGEGNQQKNTVHGDPFHTQLFCVHHSTIWDSTLTGLG